MNSFGITNCFLSGLIVNVEAPNRNLYIDTERVSRDPVGINVVLRLIPSVPDFILIISLVFTLLVWILTVLGDKKVLPQLRSSQSCGLRDIQLLAQCRPLDVNSVPQLFWLHLTAFSLQCGGANWRQRSMARSHGRPELTSGLEKVTPLFRCHCLGANGTL